MSVTHNVTGYKQDLSSAGETLQQGYMVDLGPRRRRVSTGVAPTCSGPEASRCCAERSSLSVRSGKGHSLGLATRLGLYR